MQSRVQRSDISFQGHQFQEQAQNDNLKSQLKQSQIHAHQQKLQLARFEKELNHLRRLNSIQSKVNKSLERHEQRSLSNELRQGEARSSCSPHGGALCSWENKRLSSLDHSMRPSITEL